MSNRNQEKKNMQKGFTLIELMVVIVIIGILSALAIPKMFGVSAKAKAAEAPGVVANWETLNSAYAQETGNGGLPAAIGFQVPVSKWWTYNGAGNAMTATVFNPQIGGTAGTAFGACALNTGVTSTYTVGTDTYAHTNNLAADCKAYIPNF
jgi:prepilin-type N-terminal cleavage/methylation domain-containing protein